MVQLGKWVWNIRIQNMDHVSRPIPNQCNYYHQEGHVIARCPFIEKFVRQGFANHVMQT